MFSMALVYHREFAPYSPKSLTDLHRGEVCVRTVFGGMTFKSGPPSGGWSLLLLTTSDTRVIPTMGRA